jgi:hypothetical protein
VSTKKNHHGDTEARRRELTWIDRMNRMLEKREVGGELCDVHDDLEKRRGGGEGRNIIPGKQDRNTNEHRKIKEEIFLTRCCVRINRDRGYTKKSERIGGF